MIGFPKPEKHKKKKQGVTKIRKECEDLAKLIAKQRAGWVCQKCDNGVIISGSNCHGSHIIPVSHGNVLRFDPINILCLCFFHHRQWWHKNILEAADWFEKTFPERKIYIDERKNNIVKFKYEDYQNMKIELLQQVK